VAVAVAIVVDGGLEGPVEAATIESGPGPEGPAPTPVAEDAEARRTGPLPLEVNVANLRSGSLAMIFSSG
jgi:hypothetical protein